MQNLTFIIDGEVAEMDKSINFTRVYRGSETLDAKKNNYSLTVKFPFTYKNELIFKRTNSLTYKSDFPYQQHEVNVISNGVTLISEGVLTLLSTTDSFECAMTWESIDYIGLVLNDTRKLGIALKDFPELNWNYNHSLMSLTYSTPKADTYGYIQYNDGGGNVGITGTQLFSYPHPLINFFYLLDFLFSELGLTLDLSTPKEDYYKGLNIRPNKEYDRFENNIFEFKVDCFPPIWMINLNAAYIYPSAENTGTSPTTPSKGNNSYYFKTWVDSTDGEDAFYNDFTAIQQIYRFRSFANSVSTMYITNFVIGTGGRAIFKHWKASDETWYTLFTVSGNSTYTLVAEDGDWFSFSTSIDNDTFDIRIETNIDDSLTTPNELRFPSMYHIPTCIDMTVGEFVNEALNLTCSSLSYDVNTDTYSFSNRVLENASAYDLTKNIKQVKEIIYDAKYVFNKLGQNNIFKYLNNVPIDANYNFTVSNTNIPLDKTFIDSKFSPSEITVGGAYDDLCEAIEHTFTGGQVYTIYTEQPLHLLVNDVANSRVVYLSQLDMINIASTWWQTYIDDSVSLVLTGSVRLLKIDTEITDVEFKRINTKGLVYIKTYGKYYSMIEITKNGDYAEFFLLELF